MAGRTFIRLLTVVAVAASGIGTAAVAHAEPSAGPTITADLDGDHKDDRVSIVATPDGGWQLKAEPAAGGIHTAPLPDDDGLTRVGLSATAVDSDGRDEVMTPVRSGTTTPTFTIYVLDGGAGLVPITTPGGEPLPLYVGGGSVMVNGYGCQGEGSGRSFYAVKAAAHDGRPGEGQPRYDGKRIIYQLEGRTAIARSVRPFEDVLRTDPILKYDTATCAPTR